MNSTGGLGSTSSNARSGGFNDATNLRGCELKAVLPGYRSSSFNLFSQSSIGAIDVGTLLLKRLGGREGDTISMVNALAPNGAKKAFEKGKQQLAKGNVADARVEFSKAVETYPKYAAAWVELGRLQASLKENNEARQSFQKALEADPKYLPPYDQLSMIAYREQKWQELADTTSRLIQLNAYDFPQTYFFNAIANVNINKPDPAIKSAREALKADPQKFIRAQYVIGMALAQKGEFAASAEQLKSYLATNPQEAEAVKKRLTEIEKLATETTSARLDKEPQ